MAMNSAQRQQAYRNRKKDKQKTLAQDAIIRSDHNVPILRYFGGKYRLAPWVIDHMPTHKTYVEPFAGSASVLLRKGQAQTEVLSDLNPELINFWHTLRADPDVFVTALQQGYTWSRESYTKCLAISKPFKHGIDWVTLSAEQRLQAAVAFYVRQWLSYGSGTSKYASGFRMANGGSERNFMNPKKFTWAAKRLKDVTIIEQDAFDTICAYDAPDTLFYVDPPYLPSTRYGGNDYSHEMDINDHIKLLETLQACSGMVILSGYPSGLYRDTLRGWRYMEKVTSTRGTNRTEGLWLSPNVDLLTQLPMFAAIKEAS